MFEEIFSIFVKFMEFTRNSLRGIYHKKKVSRSPRRRTVGDGLCC
jgi:hypothetical protein